jgi:hypothetical protein
VRPQASKRLGGRVLLSKPQYECVEQEMRSELLTTNIFLLVLFLFTLIRVGAAAALFFVVFLSRPSEQTPSAFSSSSSLRSATRLPKSPFLKPGSIATVLRKRSPSGEFFLKSLVALRKMYARIGVVFS